MREHRAGTQCQGFLSMKKEVRDRIQMHLDTAISSLEAEAAWAGDKSAEKEYREAVRKVQAFKLAWLAP
jgi:hypothetical protein